MMLYNLGPLTFQTLFRDKSAPIFEISTIAEIQEPWRYGKCVMVKFWPGRGFLVGWWTGRHPDEDSALILAIGGREDEIRDEDGNIQDRFRGEPEPEDQGDWQIIEQEWSR